MDLRSIPAGTAVTNEPNLAGAGVRSPGSGCSVVGRVELVGDDSGPAVPESRQRRTALATPGYREGRRLRAGRADLEGPRSRTEVLCSYRPLPLSSGGQHHHSAGRSDSIFG